MGNCYLFLCYFEYSLITESSLLPDFLFKVKFVCLGEGGGRGGDFVRFGQFFSGLIT